MNVRNILLWYAMAFQAGVINAGGFLGCHRFVSHITGFATTFGEAFAKGQIMAATGAATVPLFFLLGAMISAYFVDRRVATNRLPQYTFLIIAVFTLMLTATFGGIWGWFGDFSPPATQEPSYLLLAILCLACGIQNASVASSSGQVIRTTHLTGLTTDLGIGLMRLFADGQTQSKKDQEQRATIIRIGIIGSFIAGSSIGTIVFLLYGYPGYLIPVLISGTLLVLDLNARLKGKDIDPAR